MIKPVIKILDIPISDFLITMSMIRMKCKRSTSGKLLDIFPLVRVVPLENFFGIRVPYFS